MVIALVMVIETTITTVATISIINNLGGGPVVRASPAGDANGEANAKKCTFNFSFFIKSFQRSRQQRSQNGFLIWEEVFLQVPVE